VGASYRGLSFLAVLITLISGAVTTQAAGQVVGTVAALRGSATGQLPEGGPVATLAVKDQLTERETVKTGPDSRLKIALRDGTTLSLGADTELNLDHIALSAGAASSVGQFSGYVRAVVAPVRQHKQFEIQTPSMVAAVRGTDWIQNVAAGATQIFVVRGRVEASGKGIYAGDHVVLTSGQGVTFSDGAPHTPVVRWKKPKIDLFVEATRVR
jgi:hypothetical protein